MVVVPVAVVVVAGVAVVVGAKLVRTNRPTVESIQRGHKRTQEEDRVYREVYM